MVGQIKYTDFIPNTFFDKYVFKSYIAAIYIETILDACNSSPPLNYFCSTSVFHACAGHTIKQKAVRTLWIQISYKTNMNCQESE